MPPGAQERASAASVFWSSDIHPLQTAGIGTEQGVQERTQVRREQGCLGCSPLAGDQGR